MHFLLKNGLITLEIQQILLRKKESFIEYFDIEVKMKIRLARLEDVAEILRIFDNARAFMARNGNPNQWDKNYPNKVLVESDIKRGNCYVMEDSQGILATFAFIIGVDESYQVIEGSWNFEEIYGTIHRIASNGRIKGIIRYCFDYCLQRNPYLRIDTHEKNAPMLKVIRDYGFRECGIIHVADGSPRIAFDFKKQA